MGTNNLGKRGTTWMTVMTNKVSQNIIIGKKKDQSHADVLIQNKKAKMVFRGSTVDVGVKKEERKNGKVSKTFVCTKMA